MKKYLYSTFIAMLLLSSCNLEYFDLENISGEMEVETGLVAPLVYGSMNMGDMVALIDSLVEVGETAEGVVELTYSANMVDVMVDTMDLIIDNIFLQNYFSLDIGGVLPVPPDDTAHFQKAKDFSIQTFGDTRVDTINFKGGDLLTEVESSFAHDGYVIVSSDDLLDENKQPLYQFIEISDQSGTYRGDVSHTLEGYYLYTRKDGDSSVFTLNYDFALINSGAPINPGDYCEITTSMEDVGFYSLFGYIDPSEILDETGDLAIPIYRDVPELEHLKLDNPQIDIHVQSSVGIPAELNIEELVARTDEGESEELVFTSGHPFKMPAPTYEQIGQRVSKDFSISKANSNFRDLLNLAPDTLSYHVIADIDRDWPTQEHFILDTSRLIVDADITIPLDLRITRIYFRDTMDFEGETLDTSMIREVIIKIETENELPLALDLQLYFMDENYLVLDSLFDQETEPMLLEASSVDEDGTLLTPTFNVKEANLSQEDLAAISDFRHIELKATVVTAGDGAPFVKFKSEYDLDFDISFSGKIKVNTEEL